MKMTQLTRYDVPGELIVLWAEEESESLLPLQELAIKRHNLFGGGNLLIQAPTSSGKTFIGEMAAIQAAMRRKKVVYLAPLKALAEEKYLSFKAKYEAYGLKVIISTRDHRDFDADLEGGDFSIAVVVYEKLSQLLVRRPERIEEIDLVIADELELLSDPDRGAGVEILLTRVLRAEVRLIGLSAVIGGAESLAAWMQADLVRYERRPIELRYGVLHQGRFHYRTYNDYGKGEEDMVAVESDSPWEILTQNLLALADQGETSLVFVKAKHESRQGAEALARRLALPPAGAALAELKQLEATRSRESLLRTLQAGVAFHNADLSSAERQVVERAFRSGEARVLVSTGTLAAGMNLPAQNVFLTAEKWRYDQRLGMPWKSPILRAEYENMSGRAGRYGAGLDFGRSILVAATPFDYDTFWQRYIDGEREPIHPRLEKAPLEDHLLALVASRFCADFEELRAFLEATLTGHWVWAELYSPEELAFRIRAALNRCIDTGVLTSSAEGALEATPLGRAVAAKGISLATARELEHWIAESERREWLDIDLLFALATSADGRMLNVMLTAREYDQADYTGRIKAAARDQELRADVPLNRIRNCTLQPFFEEVRAIKIALFLKEWIENAAIGDIEERYNTMAGQVLAAADQMAWLLEAAAALATALGAHTDFTDRLHSLALQCQWGLTEDLLPLTFAGLDELDRAALISLGEAGLHCPEALAACNPQVLSAWLRQETVAGLKTWAQQRCTRRPAEADTPPLAAILHINTARPGEVALEGKPVRLPDKQYRLLRLLAEHAGSCVPYTRLYDCLWADAPVEVKQIHAYKRKLLSALEAVCPHRTKLIRTVPKQGYILELPEEAICWAAAPLHSAA